MKTSIKITIFLMIFGCLPLIAQTPDLELQKEITPGYIIYLAGREFQYLSQIVFSGDADDTPTMKAHMGLAILQIAWTHVRGDTFVTDIEPLIDDIGENFDSIGCRFENDIVPILESESQSEFFDLLVDFFESGTYPAFRDSVSEYCFNIGDDFEEIGDEIDEFGRKLDAYSELFGNHWDAVAEGTADFEFSFTIIGSKYEDTVFIFSRHFFDMIDIVENIGENMGESFDDGFSWMDSVMVEPGGDVMPGITSIRRGLCYMDEMLDTIQVILTDQPFAPFEIDVSGIDSLQEVVSEIDTMLGGKEYTLEPEDEGKVIKPLAIFQNMPDDGLWELYEDFYCYGESETYTFGEIFPLGVTQDMLAMIRSDAVLNSNDDEDGFDVRIAELKAGWLAMDPMGPDDHLGVALVLIYELLNDEEYFDQFEQVFDYLDEGRIDSLTYCFGWDSFDLHDDIAEIRYHLDEYINSEAPTNFVVLVKEEEDLPGHYEIGENSEFSIVHITVPQVAVATGLMSIASDGLTLMGEGLTAIHENMQDIFVLDLDPTFLNFSEVESDSDLILILESSNPDFLSLTSYGVEKFYEAGDWLEQAFEKLGIFFDQMTDLAYAVYPYEEDFDINGEEFIDNMEETSDVAWDIYNDFANPDSTVVIDGERVNLSAWFDNPPESFLMMWKNYVFGIDSTLGGIFPDRFVSIDVTHLPSLPKEFYLHPVYPNPFNPVAKIVFDLPKVADVKLSIVNLNGEKIEELVNQKMKPGKVKVLWDASKYPSGIYFGYLEVDGKISVRKMTLLK